jgi:hypothetical protein
MPNDPKSIHPALSRRALLRSAGSAAAAACLGVAAAPALAQPTGGQVGCSAVIPQKSPKDLARHISHNNSYRSCGNCRFFLSPDQCVVVEGQTSLESSCSLWAQRGGQIGCRPDQAITL